MPKLPAITGNQAVKAFKIFGFVVDRVKGSHHIMVQPGHPFILTVPVHGNENVKPGTLRSLIHAAGVTVDEFCEALNH